MKPTTLLSFVFIVSVFSANLTPESVFDVTGKNLRAGVNYHVMPAATGGGITLGPAGPNNICPLGVTQLQAHEYGLPLTLTPVNPKKRVIRLSTDVNIKFSGRTLCNESNVWNLNYYEAMKQYVIEVGGVEGNPGRETVDNWFKIEKTENGYKFVFCPTVCNYCKVLCRDVGIFEDDNGMKRMALSDVPFSIIFYR